MEKQGHLEPTGQAKITPAFNLPSAYVLHTVGPIISGALSAKDCELLASCYRSCLELAKQHGIESVAFCCISTGEFRFPNQEAAEIAVQTVKDFLADNSQMKVVFNVFKDVDLEIYRGLLGKHGCFGKGFCDCKNVGKLYRSFIFSLNRFPESVSECFVRIF